jgi:surfeit locus 1 family protein
VALGLWQLDRLDQRRAFDRLVEERLSTPAEPIDELIAVGAGAEGWQYRRVEVRGRYDANREFVLFGRTLGGIPGNHVLTPIVTEDGTAVLVDRGWIPIELDDPPIAQAAPSSAEITATGVMFPSEGGDPGGPAARAQPLSDVGEIDLARIQAALPYDLAPGYLWLQGQRPAGGQLPRPVPLPDLTDAPPHLSYAIQWFVFAAIAVVGYGALLRRELSAPD